MSSPLPQGANQRELRKEATRRKVFEAAMTVFRRDGIAAARVEDIVRIAGVSRGTFYFHFSTKELVIVELFGEQEAGMCARLTELPTDATLRDILGVLADAYQANWGAEPHLMYEAGPIALRYAARNAPSPPGVHPALETLILRLKLLGCPESTSKVPCDLAAAMYLFDLLVASLGWSRQPTVSLRQSLQPVIELFVRGLGAPDPQPSA